MALKWEASLMKASNKSGAAGPVQQHMHWTFIELGHALPLGYFSILYYSMFVTYSIMLFLLKQKGRVGGGGGGLFRGPLLLVQYSLRQPFMTPSKARKVLSATGHALCSARL